MIASSAIRRCIELLPLPAAALLAGCLVSPRAISPEYPRYVEDLVFHAEQPIARELRYTYQEHIGGDDDDPLATADPVTKQALARGDSPPLLSATPVQAQDWGDYYSQRADEAQDRGDTDGALMYRELAVSQAETQVALNRISSAGGMLNTYFDLMSGLALVGRAWFDGDAARIAGWTAYTSGAVGEDAPEGSILHLDFMQVTHRRRFSSTARIEFFVTALLDDGRGNLFRSDRSYELYTYRGDPPESVPADAVPLVQPVGAPQPDEYLQDIGINPYHRLKAVLGRAAIANLYDQIARSEAPPD